MQPVKDHSPVQDIQSALSESEHRYAALVSSIPGLVFQLQRPALQDYQFTYLSEGCEALLGLSTTQLLASATPLFAAMEQSSALDFREQLQYSADKLKRLDWEGRVWIDAWQDMKWVNIRASVRQLGAGLVQWDGIMLNITQSKREKHEVEQARRDLQALTAHLNQVKEQERISIAREIHDDLGGNLTAMKLSLSTMMQQIQKGHTVPISQAEMLQSIIDQTFEAVHRISGNLRPNILDLGLVDALDWQVDQFRKQLGIAARYETNCAELEVDTDLSMALFRICQEALSNVAKYAQATEVSIQLHLQADQRLTMRIRDNGIGIQPVDKIKTNSFGLRGMQERVTALQGSFDIGCAADGTGTEIVVTVPLAQ